MEKRRSFHNSNLDYDWSTPRPFSWSNSFSCLLEVQGIQNEIFPFSSYFSWDCVRLFLMVNSSNSFYSKKCL